MHGLIESMRGPFAEALSPFKGGRSGRAEILRSANSYASTGEFVNVHYEPTRSEDGGVHTYSESGMPAYTVFLDGRLATPLRSRDRLTVRGITLQIEFGAFPANVGPVDSFPAVLYGEAAL
jgi:hypothetical protein